MTGRPRRRDARTDRRADRRPDPRADQRPDPRPELVAVDASSRDALALRAAAMYYLQDLTMEAIGRQLGTSRSTVSRLVKHARDAGLVEIRLHSPQVRSAGLGARLSEAYGVEAYVVPVIDTASEVVRLEQVARTAARLLGSWFDSDMVLGIAWGTTLAAIARELPTKPTRGSAVVQLNGAISTRTTGDEYAGELVERFGAAFGAQLHHFPVPAFFDFADTKTALWRERSIRRILDLQSRCDIALFSVGALSGGLPSHVYSAGYLEADDLETLDREDVVGDVCTVFLRSDGSFSDIELNSRATGPNPAQLQRIPRRVCVVSGDNKVAPLRAALRARAATHLVLDERTAHLFVERYHL